MVDNAVSTLVPEQRVPGVIDSPHAKPQVTPINTETDALFDSIAREGADEGQSVQSSSLTTFFTAVLWTGYAIAIVVAVVLVWSAAKELLH
jgi:hypothetical protein